MAHLGGIKMAAWLFITVQDISRLMNLNGIRSRDERYVLQGVGRAEACENESILQTIPVCHLLYADPSPLKTPELIPYLSSELPKWFPPATAPESLRSGLIKPTGLFVPGGGRLDYQP